MHAMPYRFQRAKTAIVNLGLEDWQERMARWFGALSPRSAHELVAFRLDASAMPPHVMQLPGPRNTALRKILCFDQTSWLPDNLLERGDRMTMAASLEARMPFMDHELAAFVSALPDNMRVHGRTTKWMLREAMKRMLPAEILERPKVGFRVPVNEWFRGPMKGYPVRPPDRRRFQDIRILQSPCAGKNPVGPRPRPPESREAVMVPGESRNLAP